ncbi:hypothetical protein HRH59_09455 [Rheinheimera sp. YQF-2]|uniref:Uncharacterized protein n=1 Tax=Rheinheimera lutimaris TaxID=2740584 RepID=A0A7Y5AQP6_9GAMM|nr:hypothetical protein [Rheinheimera lutimaris]NRQ42775.1 hypothetical protein [Rheinheimera lutimaris]
MAISNINNNTAQLYTQEKPAAATLKQQNNQNAATAATSPPSATDSVQISERAQALLQQERASNTQGNGAGIEPPGNAAIETQGNGAGIEPPSQV